MDEERIINLSSEQMHVMRESCKEKIAFADALTRLHGHADFKLLLKEYVEDEPGRLVNLLGEQSFNMSGKKAEYRDDIHERMIGISRFSEFIRNTYKIAEQAQKTLSDLAEAESEYYDKVQ